MCFSHLIYTVRPCLINTCHAAPMLWSDYAVLLKATAQNGRRETACGRPVRIRLLPTTKRSSTKVVFRRITISDASGQCETKQRLSPKMERVVAAHYKKDSLLNCWTSILGYFRLSCRLSRRIRHCRSRAGARDGMCELTKGIAGERYGNGMAAAWARHAMCESVFSIPGLSNFMLNRAIFYSSGRLVVSFRKQMFLYFICLPKLTAKLGSFLVVKYSTTHLSCRLSTEHVRTAVITEGRPFCDAAGLSQHQTALIIAKKLLIRMPCLMSFILLRNNTVQQYYVT